MAVVTIDDTTVTGSGTAPNAPTNLTIEPEWDSIRLHWDNPTNRDLDYIQIWRSTTNVRSAATMVAQVKANDYNDHSLETGTRYYWIRAINTVGLTSDYLPNTSTTTISGIPEQVAVTSAANNDVLQYDSASSSWVNTPGLRVGTRMLGALEATTNANYTFPVPALTTTTNNNGLDVASSMPASTQGNGAQQQIIHYYGDTFASNNTTSALNMKAATGNSVTGGSVPFTGASQVAAGAVAVNNALGTVNFNGYATSGWSELIASQNQGGGFNASHGLQVQAIAAEAFADGTLSVTPTSVTRSSFTLSSVTVTGTKGQIAFTTTFPAVGNAVLVTGTNAGDSTGISAGVYYVIATNATTTATLSATPGGVPIDTTAGTTTGLTFLRQFITVGYTSLGYLPFGLNAKVTVFNIDGVTNGTYMAQGTSTLTSMNIGVSTTSVPGTFGASPTLTCPTVTAMGTSFRVRAMPLGKPGHSGNRVELVNHNATTAKYRSDTFVIASAAYGTTGVDRLTVDSVKITASLPVVFPSMDTTARNLLTALAGMVIFNTTTVKLECYDGTTWQALF